MPNQFTKKGIYLETYMQILQSARDLYLSKNWTISRIARIFNISRKGLSRDLKKNYNLNVLKDGKKSIDSYIFSEIDTEEKAYWLGFMYADGYISNINNKIELALQVNDINHLEKFKNFLKSHHKISKKAVFLQNKEYFVCRISITDFQIHSDLIKHGCISNKTLTMNFPQIKENLLKHFIRGYFDGDGCLSLNSQRPNFYIDFTCGLISFLSNLKEIIIKMNYNCFIIKDKKSQYTYRLVISGNKKSRYSFLEYLYKDSKIYLDRKYEKYLLCRIRSNDMRRSNMISAELSGKTVKL